MAATGASPSWTVTSQRETMEQDPASGAIGQGWRVYFTLLDGQTGSVFVPNAIYHNTDAVKDLISKQATAVMAVRGLSS